MSRLSKYRRPAAENLTRQYATKLPESLADEFEAYCRELNLTPSEALRLLVYEEMESVRRMKNNQGYLEIPDDAERYLASALEEPIDIPKEPRVTKPRPKSSKHSGWGEKRLTTVQWEIEKELPCPVCRQWGKSVNFARDHVRGHGLPFKDKTEFLHHPDYKPIVEQMYQERMGNRTNERDEEKT